MNDANNPSSNGEAPRGRSWFKAFRDHDADELLELNPLALVLAYVIAKRAQWSSGFNRHNLQPGEALIGDHEKCGMTRQQYRTAKQILQSRGFATFKSTVKGTIAKLADTRLFSVLSLSNQPTEQPTPNRQPTDAQPLPRLIEGIDKDKVRKGTTAPCAFSVPTEKQFTDYCTESGLGLGDGAEACDEFWRMHQQDNWTIGGEKIKYWKKALRSFALHYENCHNGEYSPPLPSKRTRYRPEIEEVVARCCVNGLTPDETMACVAFIRTNGFVVESLPGEWAEVVGPDGWKRAVDEWAVRNVGERELYNRLEQQRAEKSQASPPASTQP